MNRTVTPKLQRSSGELDVSLQFGPMRAAVIGLGALGSELVRLLGGYGIGELLLIDHDRVEEANVARDAMYSRQDIGLPKAFALGRRCRGRFPGTRFEIAATEVADVGWQRLQCRDVLFGCVDRDSARLETARIATRLGVPVCDGGLSGSRGRVSWFGESCFCCRLTAARRRELLSEWQSQAYPCGAADPPAATGASSAATPTAALMLQAAVEGLRAKGSFSRELHADRRVERIALTRSPKCPFHETAPLTAMSGKFADALEQADEVTWEWPICTSARCRDCGAEWRPFIRAARMRGSAACPACGSARVLVLEAVRSVTKASEWVMATPQQVGLPDHHLFVMRSRSGE